jgi:hypothetical protein
MSRLLIIFFGTPSAFNKSQREEAGGGQPKNGLLHREVPCAMRHLDFRRLIDQGRKAGLGTAELYSAMAMRRMGAGDRFSGPSDGNGYVSQIGREGFVSFRPAASCERF